jgi:branched-chain amino acid aminotransferase
MIVWRDGRFVESEGAVSATDRGFLIGDGVFETVLIDNGRPAFLAAHLARLRRGAEALGINVSLTERDLRAAISGLTERSGAHGREACRITVTRSGGARGLIASPDARTQALVSLAPFRAPKPEFLAAVSAARRFSQAPTNGFKCAGAYAANMIARMEAARAGADEAIMLNEFGRVAGAGAANLFLIEGDTLLTPPEREGATPGIARAVLIECARALGVAVRIEPLPAAALAEAPLIFTNSLIGATPGRLAATTRTPDLAIRLGAAYEARLEAELAEPAQ